MLIDWRFPDVWRPLEWFKSKEIRCHTKPRNVERRKMICELLLQRHKRKSFLMVMKNGYATIIRSAKNHGVGQAVGEPTWRQSRMAPSSVWWDQLGVLYSNPTKPLLGNTINNNWCNWVEHWSKNDQIMQKDTTFSITTMLGHILRNRSRKR